MSANYFFLFYSLFVGSTLFLWLLGATFFFRLSGLRSLFHAPWIGLGLLVGVLQIVHLLSPIDRKFSISFVATAFLVTLTIVLVRFYHRFRSPLALKSLPWFGLLAVTALLAFVPVFNSCTKEMYRYDLGLYYLKTIRWTQNFPIVPGLANVQDHLGFNQSAFLPTSLFDSLLPNGWGLFLVGGILPWLGITLSLFALLRLAITSLRHDNRAEAIEVAYAISLPAWIFTFLTSDSSSASPDSVSACLMLHTFLIFASFVLQRDEESRASLGEIILLGSLCLCVKLNSLGFVVGIWLACAAILVQRQEGSLLLQRRVGVMGALSIIILATWVGRGVVLSGYPFFPSSAIAMPMTWRTPATRVDGFRTLIRGWARDRENVAKIIAGLAVDLQLVPKGGSGTDEPIHLARAKWLRGFSRACGVCDLCKTATTKFARFSLPGCSTLNLRDFLVHNGPGAEIFRNDSLDVRDVSRSDLHSTRFTPGTCLRLGEFVREHTAALFRGLGIQVGVGSSRAPLASNQGR